MKLVKSFLLYLVLIIGIILVAAYSSVFFAGFANNYLGLNWGGGWLDLSDILGIFLGYALYVSFILTLFGGEKKYWVLGFLLVPLLFLELIDGDLKFFGFSVLLALVGWALGFGLRFGFNKVLSKKREL